MKWNGKNYRPLVPQKIKFQEEKFDVEEYLKSLAEKHDRVPVWRSVIGVNVPVEEGPQPSPSVTPSNTPTGTPTGTPTNTPTTTITLTPTGTPTGTPTPTPSAVAFDSGATAYLNAVVTAGGTVDATMSAATNTFFTSIRSSGLLSKMVTMYPFIGGTAASHAINAINPTGSTGIFNGGWTHSVSGSTPNGVNGYLRPKQGSANADVIPDLATNFTHGLYINEVLGSGDLSVAGGCHDGAIDLTQVSFAAVNQVAIQTNCPLASAINITRDTNGGLYGGTRISNTQEVYQQNASGLTNSSSFALSDTHYYAIGARNSGGSINEFFSKRFSFAFLGSNFTAADMITMYNAIQTYQTSLSRQI